MPTNLAQIIRQRDVKLRNVMHSELTLAMQETRAQYTRVTLKWKNKPDFRVMMVRAPKFIIGRVVVRGKAMKIFQYVDKGTRPHFIRPRFAPYLFFRLGYSAKTKPIARFNVGTGQSFGKPVKSLLVLHPGSEARKFSLTFAESLRKTLKRRIEKAIARA